jgi:DNA-binding NtrC family response regulator
MAGGRGAGAGAEDGVVVASAALRELFERVGPLSRSKIPVLILGETGAGKEVLAEKIHALSPRRAKPLVVVNCAAIPEGLVEATLFGHEKGSFTGATTQQKGLFEAADGGTLMLDEVGDLPRSSQAALLRVLETGRVRRVGAAEEISVDVRVVAATHRDLESMSKADDFRNDLLFRLSGESVTVPPLRDRVEEIEPLSLHFLRKANEANGRSVSGIEPRAMALLKAYSWPGNVRELRNAIERAVVLSQADVLTAEDLPERVRGAASLARAQGTASDPPAAPAAPAATTSSAPEPAADGDLRTLLARYEAQVIVNALNACSGNQKATAVQLNLPLRTLVHKMQALGIKRAHYAGAGRRGGKRPAS